MPDPSFDSALKLHRAGQVNEAAALYRQILRSQPAHPDALYLLGLIEMQGGRPAQALELFSKAKVSQPKVATYPMQMGMALRALGLHAKAIEEFRAALTLDPTLAEAHHQLGNSLKSLRRFAEAIPYLRRASELAFSDATVWLNLGVTYLELALLDDAVKSFRRAIGLAPPRAEAHNILGATLLQQGKISEAKQQLLEALRLQPTYSAAHDNLGRLLRSQGRVEEAIVQFRAALNNTNPNPLTHSNLLYTLNFSFESSPASIFAEHQRWGTRYAEPFRALWRPHENILEPERRLRIGYVSPDFVHHAVAYFFEPVLATHDTTGFEIFCYSNVAVPDYVTARLRKLSAQWRDIAGLTDDQVAEKIREDKIDLLIDLAGHTARHRLLTFARKPAPIQLTWLGYPNTTGVAAIDYRITEAVSDPVGETEALHTEKLVRLPETFSCYQPPIESPPVSSLPAVKAGYVTFGCFNHFSKITPRVVELWIQLLQRLPTARLFLKARSLVDPETAKALRDNFDRHGLADRLELNGDELSVASHLSLYHRVDIALDTFPYSGTTTTCEALWMGVPVVTLAGRTHVSRVTASLVSHLGFPEWITYSEEEYIQCAAALATDLRRLAELRASLRERMRQSPLCDAPRFAKNLEASFRTLWLDYIARRRTD